MCRFSPYLEQMSILRISIFTGLFALKCLGAESPAEQKVAEAIKSPELSVVHLWAPWCSNCQTELKNGGWLKMVKDNPQVKFYFVSVWNDGGDGKSMLSKFQIADQANVTVLADPGPRQLFEKLENQKPNGSIKDRIAVSMIEAAEEEEKLQPGGTVIEATAGNTGLGLALVAPAKGYRVILVIPDKMSQEKISHVKALGAEVVLTRSDVTRGHPEYYQDVAARLAEEIPGAFYVNQFGNPANPLAHERTTGPEIWEQMRHDVDAVVVGVGSGGTLTGLGRFFNRVKPRR